MTIPLYDENSVFPLGPEIDEWEQQAGGLTWLSNWEFVPTATTDPITQCAEKPRSSVRPGFLSALPRSSNVIRSIQPSVNTDS